VLARQKGAETMILETIINVLEEEKRSLERGRAVVPADDTADATAEIDEVKAALQDARRTLRDDTQLYALYRQIAAVQARIREREAKLAQELLARHEMTIGGATIYYAIQETQA
jgi:hypothetical protein